jgi:hypothetical protein
MTDIVLNTMDETTRPANRLKAIKIYAEGVRDDFPEAKVWMDNFLILAGFDPISGEPI